MLPSTIWLTTADYASLKATGTLSRVVWSSWIERLSPAGEWVIPPGRVDQTAVDLGCHWGRYTRVLSETYGLVWGIDIAATAIQSASAAPNVRYQVLDLEDPEQTLAFVTEADLFIAIGLLELLREPAQLCARLGRLARTGSQ